MRPSLTISSNKDAETPTKAAACTRESPRGARHEGSTCSRSRMVLQTFVSDPYRRKFPVRPEPIITLSDRPRIERRCSLRQHRGNVLDLFSRQPLLHRKFDGLPCDEDMGHALTGPKQRRDSDIRRSLNTRAVAGERFCGHGISTPRTVVAAFSDSLRGKISGSARASAHHRIGAIAPDPLSGTHLSASLSWRSQQRWDSRSSEHHREIFLATQLAKPGISRKRQENAGSQPDQRAL